MSSLNHDEIVYLLPTLLFNSDGLHEDIDNILSSIDEGSFPETTLSLSDPFLRSLKELLHGKPLIACRLSVLLYKALKKDEEKLKIKLIVFEQLNAWITQFEETSETKELNHAMQKIFAILPEMFTSSVLSETETNVFLMRLAKVVNSGLRREFHLNLISLKKCDLILSASRANSHNAIEEFDHRDVFRSCLESKMHWLYLEIIKLKDRIMGISSNEDFILDHFSRECLILLLIDILNKKNFASDSLDLLNRLLPLISTFENDLDISMYLKEIGRQVALHKFIQENLRLEGQLVSFDDLNKQSAFCLISHYCDLSSLDREKVISLLSYNKEILIEISSSSTQASIEASDFTWDVDVYNSYFVLKIVLNLILDHNTLANDKILEDVTSKMSEIKSLISLLSIKSRLEVLENMFACLFIRTEHLRRPKLKIYVKGKSKKIKVIELEKQPNVTHPSDFVDVSLENFRCKPISSNSSDMWNSYDDSDDPNAVHDKVIQSEFVCNITVLKYILSMLSDIIKDVRNEVNLLKVNENIDICHNYENRVQSLSELIKWAFRRYDIVSMFNLDRCILDIEPTYLSYNSATNSSSDEQVIKAPLKGRLKVKRTRRKSDGKAPKSLKLEEKQGQYKNKKQLFMRLMVSSPACLGALALFEGDLKTAERIIQTYGLHNTSVAKQVLFTQNFKEFIVKLNNTVKNIRENEEETATKPIYETAMIISSVETFLNKHSTLLMDASEQNDRLPYFNNLEYVSLTNLTDVLLNMGSDEVMTFTILKMCKSKLQSIIKQENLNQNYHIVFLNNIINIMSNSLKDSNINCNPNYKTLCGLLNDVRLPINYKSFAKFDKHLSLLKEYVAVLTEEPNRNCDAAVNKTLCNLGSLLEKDILHPKNVKVSGKPSKHTHYIKICHNYLKTISENMDMDYDSVNCTAILDISLSEIISGLLHEKNVSFEEVEIMCNKLNVNLVSNLAACSAHHIRCSQSLKCENEEAYLSLLMKLENFKGHLCNDMSMDAEPVVIRKPRDSEEIYLQLHNWVIATLLKRVVSYGDSQMMESFDLKTNYLNSYLSLDRHESLSVFYGSNRILAGLNNTVDMDLLINHIHILIENGKLNKCISLLNALPDHQILKSNQLRTIHDVILARLVELSDTKCWQQLQFIKDFDLKVNCVLNNFQNWSGENALNALQYLSSIPETYENSMLTERLNMWLTNIKLYMKVAEVLDVRDWQSIEKVSNESPDDILQDLIDKSEFELSLSWAKVHASSSNVVNLITLNLLKKILLSSEKGKQSEVKELMDKLTDTELINVFSENLEEISDLELLTLAVDFLLKHSSNPIEYENLRIGILVMSQLSDGMHSLHMHLIKKPLLIIEQLLMNAKISQLSNIIRVIQPELKNYTTGDNIYYSPKLINTAVISKNAVNSVLRLYAKKALNMRSRRPSIFSMPKADENPLLLSIDSINHVGVSSRFVNFPAVATKEEWVKDISVRVCMVCQQAAFSLLVRRHHCRKCGRVICYGCSRNRMQILSHYNDQKVRVCDDCFHYLTEVKTVTREQEPISPSIYSESAVTERASLIWTLSLSSTYNSQVREEFSYTFVPDVALCLTIMSLHCVNLEYPRFLLDRSEEIGRDSGSARVARMLFDIRRMLLLAASELYSRPQLASSSNETQSRLAQTGYEHSQRCLADIGALELLLSHGIHYPVSSQENSMPSQYVRRLLEVEKWDLALEIATKSGLPRNGVMAAWGKTCLRAGSFKLAREKFTSCFNFTATMVVDGFVIVAEEDANDGGTSSKPSQENVQIDALARRSRGNSSRLSTKSTCVSEQTMLRGNLPLLNEILTILESNHHTLSAEVIKKYDAEQAALIKLSDAPKKVHLKSKITSLQPALNIMQKLETARKIQIGDYSDFYVGRETIKRNRKPFGFFSRSTKKTPVALKHNKMHPIYYNECIYYLMTYGSHERTISFYIKHSTMNQVLQFCMENSVEVETFMSSVYTPYNEMNAVKELMGTMQQMDSSWKIWLKYILHVCKVLDSSNRLSQLYILQTITESHARAAATCVRLYCKMLSSEADEPFSQLHLRENYLISAKVHMSDCIPQDVAPDRDAMGQLDIPLSKSLLDRHLNTISFQLELCRFLKKYEQSGRINIDTITNIIPFGAPGAEKVLDFRKYPLTLFGTSADRTRLAALTIVCPKDLSSTFAMAYRIVNDFKLDAFKVWSYCVRYLVNTGRYLEVLALSDCVKLGTSESIAMSDQILQVGVSAIVRHYEGTDRLYDEQAEVLIQRVTDISIKIACYIECKILKTAFDIALQHNRVGDIRKIINEADRLGMENVKNACLKQLIILKATRSKK